MSSYVEAFGNKLTGFYGKTIDFTSGKLNWYPEGRETRTFLFLVEKERKEFYPDGRLKKTVKVGGTIFDRLITKVVEFLARRVLGSVAVVVGTFTIFPLGYVTKNAPAFCSKVHNMVCGASAPKKLERRID